MKGEGLLVGVLGLLEAKELNMLSAEGGQGNAEVGRQHRLASRSSSEENGGSTRLTSVPVHPLITTLHPPLRQRIASISAHALDHAPEHSQRTRLAPFLVVALQ